MRIVPFEAAHGRALLEGNLNDERNRPSPWVAEFIDGLVNEELAFTAIDNGHLILSAGVFELWHGVAEVWFLASDKVSKPSVSLFSHIKRDLLRIAKEHGFWRLQAVTQTGWNDAARLARFMGMESEGTMKQYGSNREDYERWALIL